MGRPSDYTEDLALLICTRLADGETLREICRDETMPHRATVFRWLATDQAFRDQYTLAREVQADLWADELVEIADDGSNDWMLRNRGDDDPVEVVNHEHVTRSKLRVDARKWLMAKAAPKKYGDKVDVQHSGPGGGAIQTETTVKPDLSSLTQAERDALRAILERRAAQPGGGSEGA